MHTILTILNHSASYLQQNGIAHPRRQAEELLCDALEMTRMSLYLEYDKPLGEEELDTIRCWLRRRGKGEPLPYISGKVQFLDCTFCVTPKVLIPRQETEILTDLVSKSLSASSPLEGKSLWDVCCGSGCIGLALKKAHPALQVTLSDLSAPALAVAERNARENQVQAELLQGDLLTPFYGRKANFIVCNPPYISVAEYQTLDREVKAHEPQLALVGGESGLIFYERIANELPPFLSSGAKVWFEIGQSQGNALYELFKAPYWKNCCVKKDWAGKDRFFSLEIE